MTTRSEMRFLDWLAARLARAGTRRAFGVPGGGPSLDLIAALRAHGIDTQLTAREDAATIMAGVSGLLAGTPGVAFTTKGPGLASATNGLASAVLDRLPALLIAEGFEDDELEYLSHQVFDQAALVAPLLAAAGAELLAPDPAALEDWIAHGAETPCRPAVLFLTAAAINRMVDDRTDSTAAAPPLPPSDDLDAARKLLDESRRPIVVIGLEAVPLGVVGPLRDFVEALGAPALTTYMARGCIGDPNLCFAGIFTGGAIEQPLVREADLIVLVGLDPVELIRKPWPYDAPVLDICARVHEPHYVTPTARIKGPLAGMLRAIGDTINRSDWRVIEIARHRQHFLDGMAAGGAGAMSSAHVVQAAAKAFGAGAKPAFAAGKGGAWRRCRCSFSRPSPAQRFQLQFIRQIKAKGD